MELELELSRIKEYDIHHRAENLPLTRARFVRVRWMATADNDGLDLVYSPCLTC